MTEQLLMNYLQRLVDALFKIIPMYEEQDDTLQIYICALRDELIGADGIMSLINNDPMFFSIICNLQYFADHPDCGLKSIRRGVFKSINGCNAMMRRHAGKGVRRDG